MLNSESKGLGLSNLRARQGDAELARAAREAAGTRYELIGELGRSEKSGVAFLARNRELDALVALLLTRDGGSLFDKGPLSSVVLPELGETVPSSDVECPVCGVELQNWAHTCANCWSDVSGIAPSADAHCTPAELLADARRVARGSCTIVGHLTRAGGGGAVYFGRSVASGRVSAFRLVERAPGDPSSRTLASIRELKLLELPDEDAGDAAGAAEVAPSRVARGTPRATVRVADPTPARGRLTMPRDWSWRPSRAQLLGGAAAVIVATTALLLLGRDDSAGGGAPAPAAPPAGVMASELPTSSVHADSAELLIGGEFPEGAVVTLNGIVLGNRRLVLAPGVYVLAVTAPGYAPIDYRLSLKAGEETLWTPRMERSEPSTTASTPPTTARTAAPSTAASTRSADGSADRSTVGARGSCSALFAARRWEAAAQQCAREAEQGKASSQYNVGLLYLHGRAAPRDDARAATWFHRAASRGHRDASYQLGLLTEAGRGVPRSASDAADHFLTAATAGEPNAQMKIGRAYERGSGVGRDRAEAVKWYRASIQQGNSIAKGYLGMLLMEGSKDVARDTVEGIALVRAAAHADVLEAQRNLGLLLARGRGIARDPTEARVWLRRASERGDKEAAAALRDLEKQK